MTMTLMNSRTALLMTIIVPTAAAWIYMAIQMNRMDMGVATRFGSFGSFMFSWVVMMSAMMLPGATPAALRFAHVTGSVFAALRFIGSYLVIWALLGIAIYAFYRPHGDADAGVLVVAAGIYELTPLKRICRKRCCGSNCSGFEFGLFCVGSCIGLMLIQVALGFMSLEWMLVITVLCLFQKLLPVRAFIDVPLALLIVGFGLLMIIAPPPVRELVHTKENIMDCAPLYHRNADLLK
jgi:predicted metal-binding membrane protein